MVYGSKGIVKSIKGKEVGQDNIDNEMPTHLFFKMKLNNFIFKDEASNFFVASATLDPKEDNYQAVVLGKPFRERTFTIVGSSQVMCSLESGQDFKVWGCFEPGKQANSVQFSATAVQELIPSNIVSIEHFLVSGRIQGVGPVLGKRMVAMFGERTIDVLENTPDDLLKVQGLNIKKLDTIKKSWQEWRAIYDIVSTMILYEIGDVAGMKIYEHFKERSLDIIKNDPYALTEVESIGFKTADKIAQSNGLSTTDPKRIEKCIFYTLEELADNGHTAYPIEDLKIKVRANLNIDISYINDKMVELMNKNEVISRIVKMKVKESKYGKKFYMKETTVLAHKKIYNTERNVAGELHRLVTEKEVEDRAVSKKEINTFLLGNPFNLDDSQIEAAEVILSNKVSVLTGGPGTGKTHTLKSLLHFFKNSGRIVEMVKDPALEKKKYMDGLVPVLSAPTGRAAKRMFESTDVPSSTIHRLLGFKDGAFEFNRQNKLKGDVFIVDESSMIDVFLASAFFSAIPDYARVIIVGDFDQLSSVGAGDVLKNIINSRAIAVARLKKIHRQAEGSNIILAAHDIINEKLPKLWDYDSKSDFVFVETPPKNSDEAYNTVLGIVRELLSQNIPANSIQILTPKRESQLGVYELNKALRLLLNDQVDDYETSKMKFIPGDRVMQLKNNKELEIYNGDVGFVQSIDEEEGILKVKFDDRIISLEGKGISELVLAYASTIHKSQGSDYPYVIIPIVDSHNFMWDINLLYTAVTRGKTRVILVGDMKTLQMSVATFKQTERVTTLREELMEIFNIKEDGVLMMNQIVEPTLHDLFISENKSSGSGNSFGAHTMNQSTQKVTKTSNGFTRRKVDL